MRTSVFPLAVVLLCFVAGAATLRSSDGIEEDPALKLALESIDEPVGDVRVVDLDDLRDLPEPTLKIVKSKSAFRLSRGGELDPVIYIPRWSWYYQKALSDPGVSQLLAGSIVHESAHGRDADEGQAIEAEIAFLKRIRAGVTDEARRMITLYLMLRDRDRITPGK